MYSLLDEPRSVLSRTRELVSSGMAQYPVSGLLLIFA